MFECFCKKKKKKVTDTKKSWKSIIHKIIHYRAKTNIIN